MLLVPVLLILGYWVAMQAKRGNTAGASRGKVSIPWFALGFLAVIGFNSFNLLPAAAIDTINYIDTFLLTMAMVALGARTSIDKFKKAGPSHSSSHSFSMYGFLPEDGHCRNMWLPCCCKMK